jgi:hypothetical protein
MRNFVVLSCSALLLFVGGSTWIALYPPVPTDLAGVENLDAMARHVRIPLADGDALDGWYLPPRNGAVVVLLHGYGRDHTRSWRYGGFLSRAGYGLLAFDFRSSRTTARLPTTLGHYEQADARAALSWLRGRPRARPLRIGLLGESLGGSVALLLGAESPDVKALVVDCAFANGEQALEDACERWAHLPRWPSAALCRPTRALHPVLEGRPDLARAGAGAVARRGRQGSAVDHPGRRAQRGVGDPPSSLRGARVGLSRPPPAEERAGTFGRLPVRTGPGGAGRDWAGATR